ncbi:MAG TPA: CoA pyrophosphatase [Deltaproteobacteria bacterium]|nr:CoA pyrophosphatase [Deltaproteobacteria bacterium]HXK48555.1 CoA pyrophosphatase [Deltaproteobacteria bacterium]
MQESRIVGILRDEQALRDYIRSTLAAHRRRIIPREDLKESAVLVPLCWKDGEPQVVVTKRSMDVEHHKGEISFPGGRVESSDNGLVNTALREAEEEIGLCPSDVDVLGLLDDHVSIVGYHITPVVGAIPFPYDFRINSESESLLMVSLRQAFREDAWMAERSFFRGKGINIYFLEIDGGVVWGATARMLKHFVDLLAGQPIPFGAVSDSARVWVKNILDSQGGYKKFR